MEKLVSECRDMIRAEEARVAWLRKHNFNHEADAIQMKIGGMFQVYDKFRDELDRAPKE